jgi:hypothetical protein
MNIMDKIEKWWSSLSDTQQLIVILIVFVWILWSSPFIN